MNKKIASIKKSSYESEFCSLSELNIEKMQLDIDDMKSEYPYIPSVYLPYSDPTPVDYYDDLIENSVNKLINKKFYWAYQTKYLTKKILQDRPKFIQYTNKIIKKKITNKNYTSTTNRLYSDFIYYINSDPDPNFNGIYNWYYTGGTTALLDLYDQMPLTKRNGPNFDSIEIIQSEDYYDFLSEKTNKMKLNLVKDEPIYQIISNDYDGIAFLGIRQKKNISVYIINSNEEDTLKVKLAFRCPSVHNLTGLVFNPFVREVTFATTVNDEIFLYDIQANRCVIKEHFNRNPNRLFPWNWPVCLEDPHLLLLMDTHNINLMDTRNGLKSPSLKDPLFCNQSSCNNFCQLICHPDQENLYYAVSRHSVYLRDTRNLSPSNSINVWTHWLKQEPCYTRHFHDYHNKGILLASQNGEVSLVLNDQMACVLPTLGESVNEQILQGHCLAPETQLNLKQPITGLELFQEKYGGKIMIQTAPGNLFIQNLTSINKENLEEEKRKTHISFKEWQKKLEKSKPTFQLKYSAKRHMKTAFHVMKKKCPKSNASSKQIDKNNRTWISKKKILTYADPLDTVLLDIWDIKEEPEWAPIYDNIVEQSTNDKINYWFSNQDLFSSQEMENPSLEESFRNDTMKLNEEKLQSSNVTMMSQDRSYYNNSNFNVSQNPSKKRKFDVGGF